MRGRPGPRAPPANSMTLLDRYVTAVVSAGFVLLAFAVAHGPLPPDADVSMVAIFAPR